MGLLYSTRTYPVIEPISGGTHENGPVVGVPRAGWMSAIKVGDDLLTGNNTADRPNGQTDEQLTEAHSRVCLGNSAPRPTRSCGVPILGIDLSSVCAAMHGEQRHVTAVGDV